MSVIPVTISASPLAEGESYTPQELFDAMVARLYLETQESYVLIGTGAVLPVSDQGPFMLNGTTLYVWDSGSGMYVPQTIEFEDDIDPKPFRGNMTANQTIVFAGAGSDTAELVYTEDYDPGSVFADSTFVAPADGIYSIKAKCSVAATVGTPTDNILLFYLKKNTFQMPLEQVFVELDNIYVGRTLSIATEIELQAGDTINVEVGVSIGGGTGTWTIYATDSYFCGHKIMSS